MICRYFWVGGFWFGLDGFSFKFAEIKSCNLTNLKLVTKRFGEGFGLYRGFEIRV